MRCLKISKSGNWQFRYQIPAPYRHLFNNRFEVKRSLRTSDKQAALIKALKLEINIRLSIQSNQPFSELIEATEPAKPALPVKAIQPKSSISLDPFKCLDKYRDSKKDLVSEKTLHMAYAKCYIVLSLLDVKGIKDIRRLQAEEARKLLSLYPVNVRIPEHRER